MLWLALAGEKFGARPSKLAGIEDEVAALDFDLACVYRLAIYDNQQDLKRAKMFALENGKMLAGKSGDDS